MTVLVIEFAEATGDTGPSLAAPAMWCALARARLDGECIHRMPKKKDLVVSWQRKENSLDR